MRFAKELFFERYLVDQDDMSYFDELEILDVIYLKIQDRIIVKISLEKTLPFRLHQQLKDYIAKALDHEVELYYKTRVSELALCEAISYIKDYANKHHIPFVDYYTKMVDNSMQGLPSQYSKDGVHPTIDGYNVMETIIKPIIDKELKKRR